MISWPAPPPPPQPYSPSSEPWREPWSSSISSGSSMTGFDDNGLVLPTYRSRSFKQLPEPPSATSVVQSTATPFSADTGASSLTSHTSSPSHSTASSLGRFLFRRKESNRISIPGVRRPVAKQGDRRVRQSLCNFQDPEEEHIQHDRKECALFEGPSLAL
ncbi:hypothetical protein BD309DRAFT_959224 [Dichomitus squalens]|nr:hypothetical protein BD309DRAFT_959224 [Dichomitus squalens]